jgi:uncharacterized sulfatase
MDASPTKAWLVAHRNDPQWKWHYEYAFAKRPGEELYDLRSDPDQIRNVAGDEKYAKMRQEMAARLMKILAEADDPRVVEQDCRFDKPPFAAPEPKPRR